MEGKVFIDAEDAILGRLASKAAKLALEGKEVIIFNAEKAVISGKKKAIVNEVKRKLETRTLASVEKSPKHPRRPDLYVRRVIRGMLPWKKPKGKNAYKKVKVYIGIPEDFTGKLIKIPEVDSSKLKCKKIKVEELSKEVGGLK
ncbi:50S ribosomal protein L13 [Candidatus Bathyarchaeota archaeon]|nr:50S ribosomal protein L13 [Candidatus Bathyarchaeota archaeon]